MEHPDAPLLRRLGPQARRRPRVRRRRAAPRPSPLRAGPGASGLRRTVSPLPEPDGRRRQPARDGLRPLSRGRRPDRLLGEADRRPQARRRRSAAPVRRLRAGGRRLGLRPEDGGPDARPPLPGAEGRRRRNPDDRGPGLLLARRPRPEAARRRRPPGAGARPVGAGNQHADAAARQEPLPDPRADPSAEGRRGAPRRHPRREVRQGGDPRGLSQRDLPRAARLRVGHRCRGGGAVLLRQARLAARPLRGRDARGAHLLARALLAVPQPREGSGTPRARPEGDARREEDRPCRLRRRPRGAARRAWRSP